MVNIMLLMQFQFVGTNEYESELIPEFCEWISNQIFQEIDTNNNKLKIKNKIKYLYTVPWIRWSTNKKTDADTIMSTIRKSISYRKLKDNTWNIYINDSIRLKNTYTSISRLVRFIDYGDTNINATGMFSIAYKNYGAFRLQSSWRLFILDELGYLPESKIIA